MADTKITALTAITTVDPAVDVLPIVDVSDTTMAASGTTKKITSNQILGSGGTATLASATITGDLTVDTSTLKVDSANNRVGIGTATPAYILDISGVSPRLHIRDNGTGTSLLDIENDAGTLYVGRENSTGSGGLSGVPYAGIMYLQGAYPLIFGTNFVERYRIDATGVATWSVAGTTAMTLNSTGLGVGGSPVSRLSLGADANTDGSNKFTLYRGGFSGQYSVIENIGGTAYRSYGTGGHIWYVNNGTTEAGRFDGSGNLGVGVASPTYKLQAAVASGADRNIFAAQIAGASNGFEILWNHATTTTRVIINAIPTSAAGLAAGTLWNDAGTIKIA
jgi:hypothetical protein